MAIVTPTFKTDWATSDGILNTDMNRIEEASYYNYMSAARLVKYHMNGWTIEAGCGAAASYPYGLRVSGGQARDTSAYRVIYWGKDAPVDKIFDTNDWLPGSGFTVPCKAPGVTFANDTWYYVFVLMNSTTEAYDFAIDSDYLGTNISGSIIRSTYGFDMQCRIGALKTSSIITPNGFVPTYAANQRFMTQHSSSIYATAGFSSGTPQLLTLNDSTGTGIFPPSPFVEKAYIGVSSSVATVEQLQLWDPIFSATAPAVASGVRITNNPYVSAHIPVRHNQVYGLSTLVSNPVLWYIHAIWYEDLCERF